MGMDDLRHEALNEQEVAGKYEDILAPKTSDTLLGMTAVERMFVSIGCFLVTSLVSLVLLQVMGKIALP